MSILQKKVYIIDDIHLILVDKLKKMGFEPVYLPDIPAQEVMQTIVDAYGLIVRSKLLITKEVMVAAPQLQFIGRAGSGVDNIDMEEAKRRNILVVNAPEGNRDAVAEHTVGMMLNLFNKMLFADQEVREFQWYREKNRGFEIKGKTIGIIGYGVMGQAVAKRLSGFDAEVLAFDAYKQGFSDQYAVETTLTKIQERADIVSIHTNLTETSKYMINADFIDAFKKPFYLFNTSRGKVLKLNDLYAALKSAKILGAGLDVLENEKFETLKKEEQTLLKLLFDLKNVILSPHVAGWTTESYEKISLVIAEKLKKILNL